MSIVLPTEKIAPTAIGPRNLILFGLPKAGKTTLLSTLPNNLILDLENGSDFVSALKIKANSIKEIKEICSAIIKAGKPYKYITVDTVTALEEMVKPLALKLYKESPVYSETRFGDLTDVLALPSGSGYQWLRQSFELVLDLISKCADNIILCGHVKDVALNEGLDGSIKDLDLVGKQKRILSAKSDAIGYVHRSEGGDLCINFGNDGEVLTGSRIATLAGKDIVIASRNDDGSFTSHWSRIYPDEKDVNV